ncbi:MAG: leukotriene A4 hydrolase C-terminal domain-containing protein, partial [Cyclobacteriaceae bacterium]
HFIRGLPQDISIEQMQQLDNAFGLTETGNSEMLVAWLVHAIKHDYKPSFKRLEEFLINTGRRKFLVPLYENLKKSEKNQQLAMEIYQKARDNYHYVATNTLDKMLKYQETN